MYLLLRVAERFGRDPREALARYPAGLQRVLIGYEVLREAEEVKATEIGLVAAIS